MRLTPMSCSAFCVVFTGVFVAEAMGQSAPDYGFAWSTVGAAGNRGTTPEENPLAMRPMGAVPYEFRIMTSKLSNTDYLEFVEAYAPFWERNADSFELTGYWIWATPQPGGTYRYDIEAGSENYAARITWEQAARYCNWLHNGRVNEAWAFETGAYDASTFRHDEGGFHHNTQRLPGAKYWIPSQDEWIKAVYYDPNRHGEGEEGYWRYPNSSDTPLVMALPEDGGETIGDLLWRWEPRDLGAWDLGQYPDTRTPWGLIDVSATVSDYLQDMSSTQNVYVGGSVAGEATYSLYDDLWTQIFTAGLSGSTFGSLRLATSVPTAGSAAMGGMVWLFHVLRRKRTC